MILPILKAVFKVLPSLLEAVRRWDAEENAKLVVEEAERAVEREIAQRKYDVGKDELVKLKAEDLILKKRIEELEGFH